MSGDQLVQEAASGMANAGNRARGAPAEMQRRLIIVLERHAAASDRSSRVLVALTWVLVVLTVAIVGLTVAMLVT